MKPLRDLSDKGLKAKIGKLRYQVSYICRAKDWEDPEYPTDFTICAKFAAYGDLHWRSRPLSEVKEFDTQHG